MRSYTFCAILNAVLSPTLLKTISAHAYSSSDQWEWEVKLSKTLSWNLFFFFFFFILSYFKIYIKVKCRTLKPCFSLKLGSVGLARLWHPSWAEEPGLDESKSCGMGPMGKVHGFFLLPPSLPPLPPPRSFLLPSLPLFPFLPFLPFVSSFLYSWMAAPSSKD